MEVRRGLSGVHCAIETSGYADPELFHRVMDSALHKRYTGVDLKVILQNAKQLCGGNKLFVIRIPVIPGVNDNVENYRRMTQWVAGAPMLEKVELLPYHKTAGAKYEMAGKRYDPRFDAERPVSILQDIFSEYQIRSDVL